jgi:hypothetical protein
MPAGTAAEDSAVFLPMKVDRAERWRGKRGEPARMGGDGVRNALTAAQPGADELIGVGPVDRGAGRTLGGAAGLARDGQDPAGFVDGGVAVQEFPSGAVDVIDAAAQQNRLQAPAKVPGGACRDGGGGQRRCSSRRALAGGGGRTEASPGRAQKYRVH